MLDLKKSLLFEYGPEESTGMLRSSKLPSCHLTFQWPRPSAWMTPLRCVLARKKTLQQGCLPEEIPTPEWVSGAGFCRVGPPDQRMAMGDTHPTPIVTDVWMGG